LPIALSDGSKTLMNKSRGASRTILTVDVGGTHVKVMTNEMRIRRGFASGPDLSPRTLLGKVRDLTSDWSYEVVSLGYPGPVIRNRPFAEPYNLGFGWVGFDFAKAFDRPTQVVNDALMQALGSYEGGRMLFLGLGTGLGSAMIVDGFLEPMELGHFHYRKGKTFEHYLGTAGLKRLGKKKWKHRVNDVVKRFVAAFEPDYVVLGGGNAKKIDRLPRGARRGSNEDAFEGGFRLWETGRTRRSGVHWLHADTISG
jgi:polyphosphate glucokinase